jgi:hypothetical protein
MHRRPLPYAGFGAVLPSERAGRGPPEDGRIFGYEGDVETLTRFAAAVPG